MPKVNYEKMSLEDLKSACKKAGLPTSGKKADLVERLTKPKSKGKAVKAKESDNVDDLTVPQLRKRLEALDLSTDGKKDELVKRLKKAVAKGGKAAASKKKKVEESSESESSETIPSSESESSESTSESSSSESESSEEVKPKKGKDSGKGKKAAKVEESSSSSSEEVKPKSTKKPAPKAETKGKKAAKVEESSSSSSSSEEVKVKSKKPAPKAETKGKKPAKVEESSSSSSEEIKPKKGKDSGKGKKAAKADSSSSSSEEVKPKSTKKALRGKELDNSDSDDESEPAPKESKVDAELRAALTKKVASSSKEEARAFVDAFFSPKTKGKKSESSAISPVWESEPKAFVAEGYAWDLSGKTANGASVYGKVVKGKVVPLTQEDVAGLVSVRLYSDVHSLDHQPTAEEIQKLSKLNGSIAISKISLDDSADGDEIDIVEKEIATTVKPSIKIDEDTFRMFSEAQSSLNPGEKSDASAISKKSGLSIGTIEYIFLNISMLKDKYPKVMVDALINRKPREVQLPSSFEVRKKPIVERIETE